MRLSKAARALVALVSAYRRWLSPLMAPRCRYHPTCSAYAADAVRAHGAVRGVGLAAWRVARCQPFSPGGVDPVPTRPAPARPVLARPVPARPPRPEAA